MARAQLFLDAGADVLFIEAPQRRDELVRIGECFGRSVPLLANMVEGGKTPILPANELEVLGFAVVIFAAGIVRAQAKTAEEFYASLHKHGSTQPFGARMFDFDGLNELLGTPELLERGRRYEGDDRALGAKESGRSSGRK
jgi:2-methylisocitrate lyase-like PEP mutase family enzyme